MLDLKHHKVFKEKKRMTVCVKDMLTIGSKSTVRDDSAVLNSQFLQKIQQLSRWFSLKNPQSTAREGFG